MRRRAVAAAVVAFAAAGAMLASASSLGVQGGTLSASTVTHPCSGTATASPVGSTDWYNPGYAGLAITLPAGCGNAAVDVTVLSGATVVAAGLGTVSGSGTVTTSPVFTDPNITVKATVSGWDLPVTYSYTPPATCRLVSGTGACSAAVTLWTGQRPGGSSSALYFEVWVTTTSSSWVPWEVTFDLANAYYPVTVTRLGNSDLDSYRDSNNVTWSSTSNLNDVYRQGACSSQLSVRGLDNSSNNYRDFSKVRSSTPRFFALVVNRTETGYYDVLSPGC